MSHLIKISSFVRIFTQLSVVIRDTTQLVKYKQPYYSGIQEFRPQKQAATDVFYRAYWFTKIFNLKNQARSVHADNAAAFKCGEHELM